MGREFSNITLTIRLHKNIIIENQNDEQKPTDTCHRYFSFACFFTFLFYFQFRLSRGCRPLNNWNLYGFSENFILNKLAFKSFVN